MVNLIVDDGKDIGENSNEISGESNSEDGSENGDEDNSENSVTDSGKATVRPATMGAQIMTKMTARLRVKTVKHSRCERVKAAAKDVPFEVKIALAGRGRGKIVRMRAVVNSRRTQSVAGSSLERWREPDLLGRAQIALRKVVLSVWQVWWSGIGNFAVDPDPSTWDEKCITAKKCPSH
ncbi:unnamed protein product [Phytophthora fragariaefolia]|uniref:Unnamed protein product n=1 Tax=Phytophthora fragariaefolia TaxID=1490495 RepID=A0A9W6TRS1_9STRA|nr:unnamed protein product [Phytophthora fragariaefolia]